MKMVRDWACRGITRREVNALELSDCDRLIHAQQYGRPASPRLAVLVSPLLAAVLALAACTTASETITSVAVPSTVATSSAPSRGPGQQVPDADPDIQACSTEVAEAAFAVVQSQQRAFVGGDFAAALQLASTGFRSSVTLPRFTVLIVSGYNFLLTNPQVRVIECRTEGMAAPLQVDVGSNAVLAYRMVAEGGQWRIDSASILKEVSV